MLLQRGLAPGANRLLDRGHLRPRPLAGTSSRTREVLRAQKRRAVMRAESARVSVPTTRGERPGRRPRSLSGVRSAASVVQAPTSRPTTSAADTAGGSAGSTPASMARPSGRSPPCVAEERPASRPVAAGGSGRRAARTRRPGARRYPSGCRAVPFAGPRYARTRREEKARSRDRCASSHTCGCRAIVGVERVCRAQAATK